MGSRIRHPDKLFEVFAEVGCSSSNGGGPFILQKYPPDYDEKDVLSSIPKFAFPCKHNTSQVDQFTFVLTDLESMYRFGYCRHASNATTCLCIISHLPWFEVFYKMLNFLAEIINRSVNNDLIPFLKAAFEHSLPMPDEPVTIVAGQDMFTFTAPDPSHLPSIPASRNLTEYYNAIDTSNMMKIFASMLHERRIIITSKKLSRLTACIHASEALLYPMHWQHLFIPVLPSELIDYVTAPMPYLIGVHTSLMEKIRRDRMEIGDAVIVDADKNEVTTDYEDLEALPDVVLSYLKDQLKQKKLQNSVMDTGDAISRAFLLALVRLIGGYRDALKFKGDEDITFERDAFVQSRPSQSMQVFLESMLQLQIFQQFINGRLILLNSGEGFHDLFEQESIKYADGLNTQSKYKEWLSKQKRKIKSQGRDIFTDMKDKAGPMMSTAVHTMKIQSKKLQSKFKEGSQKVAREPDINQMNENKMSSRKVSGGVVHSRNVGYSNSTGSYDRRPTTILGHQLATSRPLRPPPVSSSLERPHTLATPQQSRGKLYKTLSADEGNMSHDDSNLRLSYHTMDMNLLPDIEKAIMRSASAEILTERNSDLSHATSDDDISSTPSSEALSPSDDNSANIPYSDLAGPSPFPPPTSSSEEDEAKPSHMPARDSKPPARPKPPLDRLIGTSRPVAGPAPVAPPRNTRKTAGEGSSRTSPQISRPVPTRRTSLDRKGDQSPILINTSSGSSPALPPSLPLQQTSQEVPPVTQTEHSPEKMLIKFESSESETDSLEQFDPLLVALKQASPKSPDTGFGDSPGSSPGLNRSRSSRNSLMRTEAFRRTPPESPLRSGYRDDTTPDRDERKKDALADLFDPLAAASAGSRSAVVVPTRSPNPTDGNENGSESLMGDWTLDHLASSSSFTRVLSGANLTCPAPNPLSSPSHISVQPVPTPVPPYLQGPAGLQAPAASRGNPPPRPTQPPLPQHARLHHTGLLENLVSVDIGSGLRPAPTTRGSHSLPRGMATPSSQLLRSSSPSIPRNLSNSSFPAVPKLTAASGASGSRAGHELSSSAALSISHSPSQNQTQPPPLPTVQPPQAPDREWVKFD